MPPSSPPFPPPPPPPPPPHPSPPPPSSGVVGGRLRDYVEFWRRLGAPKSVLVALRGYSLPFSRPPPTRRVRASDSTILRDVEKARVVDEEVQSLLAKGAIKEVVDESPGYFSKIFVVPKKDGGWRPIINLKKLNADFLHAPHFRMDTTRDVASILRPGDWTTSIDLKDAYFHIPVDEKSRRFLRFVWRGKVFEYLVLPFGLCTAPLIFTMVSKVLKAHLHTLGIRSIFYLDDILIAASTRDLCAANLAAAISLFRSAGFIINEKKSSLIPAQDFLYLGFHWSTSSATISLEEKKRLALRRRASTASSGRLQCRVLQVLLGHATSSSDAVPLLRLHARFLQRDLSLRYRSSRDANRLVGLSAESRRDLLWIANLEPEQCRAPLWPPTMESADLEVATDASSTGWGIYFQGSMFQGLWEMDAPAHINAKELMTIFIFLRDFLPPSLVPSPRSLLWRCDNTTAIAYVRRQGGTISLPLLEIAREVLLLAHELRVVILPAYIASEENLHADAASRQTELPDWHLDRGVFDDLALLWGLPEIDLFASTESTQVRRFFAWGEAPEAMAYDALAHLWSFSLAFAFPPPPLLPRVLRKIEESTGLFILVTPFWPSRKWFPVLLGMRIQAVRRLPEDRVVDLLTGDPPPVQLPLVAWLITGGPADSDAPTPLSDLSATAGDLRRRSATTPLGAASGTSFVGRGWSSLPSL